MNGALALGGVALLVRLGMMITIPLYPRSGILPGYNDEPLHLSYVKEVAGGSLWPLFDPSLGGMENPTAEFLQPPLYYHLVSPLWRLGEKFGTEKGLYGARLGSILLGILGLFFLYRASSQTIVVGKENLARSVFATALAFPPLVIFTSLVSNDALLFTISSLLWWRLIRAQMEVTNWRFHLITTVWMVFATWTKLSGGLWIFMLPFFFSNFRGDANRSLKSGIVHFALCLCLWIGSVIPLVWWYSHHYGSLLPLVAHSHFSPKAVAEREFGALFYPWELLKYFLRSAVVPFDAVWGKLNEKIVTVCYIILLSLSGGWGVYLVWKSPKLKVYKIGLILIGVVGMGFLFFNVFQYQSEFRLVMPAFCPILTFLGVGLSGMGVSYRAILLLWIPALLLLIQNN